VFMTVIKTLFRSVGRPNYVYIIHTMVQKLHKIKRISSSNIELFYYDFTDKVKADRKLTSYE
jgi:hypothetical protein